MSNESPQRDAAPDEGQESEPVSLDAEAGAQAAPEEDLRKLADDNWNKYLRSVAELDNLRKRSARELESARKFGAERLAAAMLPVRDSIEAALQAAETAEALDLATLIEGERATLRLLDQALESAGIAEIDPVGEPFDPERHEAMTMQESATAEPGSVLAVIQKGYSLHDRVMRPARVIVARAPSGD